MNKKTNLKGVDPMKARLKPRKCSPCKGTGIRYFGQRAGVCPACKGKRYQTPKDVRRNDAYWRLRSQPI